MENMKEVQVYLASQNSNGIIPIILLVDEKDHVRYERWPGGTEDEILTFANSPWVLENPSVSKTAGMYYFDRKDASAAYVALEQRRLRKARKALEAVGAPEEFQQKGRRVR